MEITQGARYTGAWGDVASPLAAESPEAQTYDDFEVEGEGEGEELDPEDAGQAVHGATYYKAIHKRRAPRCLCTMDNALRPGGEEEIHG